MRRYGLRAGDRARLVRIPPWATRADDGARALLEHCLGGVYRVIEVDAQGRLVLDVSEVADKRFGHFDAELRVEPLYCERAL
jgi:hypothetical protein